MSPVLKSNLQARAQALKAVRTFFDDKGVLEVDTPLLSPYAPIDAHIDLFETEGGYLHSSPEYGMKKLLAEGSGDIYQLGHVFRKEEEGPLHAAEFTMIEWYRVETSLKTFLQENIDLFSLFLPHVPHEILSYDAAFKEAVGIPYTEPPEALMARGKELGFDLHDPSDVINLLWGCVVEPTLGQGTLTIVTPYPEKQAALAQVSNGTAERFEFYYQGIELGNGYHELTDPIEQQGRLDQANQERIALGKASLPYDPTFIKALEKGLPDCYGIAWGFDRLLMLKENRSNIHTSV